MGGRDGERDDALEPTDRELALSIRATGSDALKTLFDRHSAAVHEFIRTGLHDPNDIDDVFQEVFVTTWAKLDASQMPGPSALPWILTTARNLVSNANRRSDRPHPAPLTQADQATPDIAFEAMIEAEESSALVAALQKLEPLDRRIIQLCLQQGMLYKEAALATSRSTGVIRNRLARARRLLRAELSQIMGDQ